MRDFLRAILLVVAAGAAGCDEAPHGADYPDLGTWPFKHIGQRCAADTPPHSECGYPPQYYCTAAGVCASACNTGADCQDGARCVGAGDLIAGECRLPADMAAQDLAGPGG